MKNVSLFGVMSYYMAAAAICFFGFQNSDIKLLIQLTLGAATFSASVLAFINWRTDMARFVFDKRFLMWPVSFEVDAIYKASVVLALLYSGGWIWAACLVVVFWNMSIWAQSMIRYPEPKFAKLIAGH